MKQNKEGERLKLKPKSEAASEQKVPDAPPHKSTQTSFAVKDFIALGFSLVALTLSVASFYFTNFRLDNKLQVRVAEITLDNSSEDSANPEFFVVVRVAFTNAGNRPAVVLSAMYQFSNSPNKDSGAMGGWCTTAKETFPLFIQPHDIRLVDLKIPANGMIANFDSGAPVTTPISSDSGQESQFFYALAFKSLDSEGAYYDVLSDFFGSVNVSKKRLLGAGAVKGKEFLAVDLFRNKQVAGGIQVSAPP
jgi:hypothetical protein